VIERGSVDIELLWWEGCPSVSRIRAELAAALTEVGLSETEVRERQISTEADAQEARFVGSPTILIDGADPVPPDSSEPIGFACRVYHRRDGRISPTPDPDDLREALQRVLAGRSTG
jgi:hypothetical protein